MDIVDSRAALEEAESKEEKRCDRVAGCLVFAAQLLAEFLFHPRTTPIDDFFFFFARYRASGSA